MSRALRIFVILAVVTVLLSSCYPFQGTTVRTANVPDIVGSRKLVDKSFDLTGFTAVEIHNGAQAQVSQGDTISVVITVDDNVADYLDVQKVDDRLVIGLKDGSYKNITL
jgi:putative cell wall-binding protein